MFYSIVLFVFVVICLLLIGIILLQSSQSGGMGAIGGGNSYLEGALGSQGADSLLLKTTTVLAVIFMSLALLINLIDNPSSEMNYSTESVIMKNTSDDLIPGSIDTKVIEEPSENKIEAKELKVVPSTEK